MKLVTAGFWIAVYTLALSYESTLNRLNAYSPSVSLRSGQQWPQSDRPPVIDGQRADGVILLSGVLRNIKINPVTVRRAYRVVLSSKDADISDLTVDGLHAIVTMGCMRLQGAGIVVRNVDCRMEEAPQRGRQNLPFGLQVISGSNVVIEDSRFGGFQWIGPAQRFWHGEGISIEWPVSGVSIRRVTSNDNTDSGFDLKPFVRMNEVSAAGNCRNFRFWSGAEIGTLTTGDTTYRGGNSSCAGIWVNGSEQGRPRLHIRRLIVRMSRPGTIIDVENGTADLKIDECDIHAPPATELVSPAANEGNVSFGPGCAVVL